MRFEKAKWSKDASRKWVKDHDGFTDGYEETENEHRWRQYDPDSEHFHYRRFDETLPDGVYFINGFPGAEQENAMSRIEIRGIIVPSGFDDDWSAREIERGIITPESKFRRDLEAANTDESLSIYVNSPGGSVFAANEIINAVLAWKVATRQKVEVVLGAMAASMGAALTIAVSDKVIAHQNSLIMFHGAWAVMIGGKEALEDQAEALGKINANIKNILLTRYEIAPESIEEWFREGREGWLTAEEMKAAGIAQEIIGEPAPPLDLTGADLEEFDKRGLKIAALAEGLADLKAKQEAANADGTTAAQSGAGGAIVDPDNTEGNDGNGKGKDGDQAQGQQGASQEPGNGGDHAGSTGESSKGKGTQTPASGLSAERLAGREEGKRDALEEVAGQVEDLQRRLSDSEANARKMQSERDSARAELDKARSEHEQSLKEAQKQLKLANDRASKFLDGALTFSAGPRDWPEALKECKGDYATAAKAYPELKEAYRTANSRD
jgi:ATP-dependent protease ClpP protease subunit